MPYSYHPRAIAAAHNGLLGDIDTGAAPAEWRVYAGTAPPSAATPVAPTAWQASTAYAVGDFVAPTTGNGHYYRCTAAGTSGSSEPTWPTDGTTVTDGGVTWEDYGDLPTLLATVVCADPAGTVDSQTGQLTFASMTRDESADADGQASFGRLVNGDGNAVIDLPTQAGTSAVSGYLVLNTLDIVAGGPVEILSATIG